VGAHAHPAAQSRLRAASSAPAQVATLRRISEVYNSFAR
jgi:hypothetical protein